VSVKVCLVALVLDQFDAVEVPPRRGCRRRWAGRTLFQGGAEDRRVGLDMVVEALTLEDVEVGQPYGGRNRMAPKVYPCGNIVAPSLNGSNNRSLAIIAPIGE